MVAIIFLSLVAALLARSTSAAPLFSTTSSSFRLDVHSHVVPDLYKEALIQAGYPVTNGTVYTSGFPVPSWDLATHIEAMDLNQVNYSILSISAPGVNFLAANGTAASKLARNLNLAMYNYTQTYPTRLGAMCVLPLPHIDLALEEIEFCLDTLKFDGVGLYTNVNGTYLGDRLLNPVFALLNNRSATAFTHPEAPGCAGAALGYPPGMSEYPFDTVRAMENLLLTGQRRDYSNIKLIFAHGGGAMPFVANRIAGQAELVSKGTVNASETLAQFQGYLFDTASATSAAQLLGMKEFYGGDVSKIVVGTDYPYVHQPQAESGLKVINSNGNFSPEEMSLINGRNALAVLPAVADKLGLR
ncbi:amidohydrolase [Diaporthe amygdali]|uniref:amidohydrolase n=1 Tax=Phomopsis amygdali TaxID=1214568 RepID=UPI0022FEB0DC|nr:amidohydrolase [Diaporthe amygdali]KAJ0120430.1 amidohydrolase [Diaporthe amygdali]